MRVLLEPTMLIVDSAQAPISDSFRRAKQTEAEKEKGRVILYHL